MQYSQYRSKADTASTHDTLDDQHYYAQRAARERAHAKSCENNVAAIKHFELAERFDALAAAKRQDASSCRQGVRAAR